MTKPSFFYLLKISFLTLITVYSMDKLVYIGLNQINKQVFTGQKSGGKLNQYLNQKDHLDFVVFGSSRANHHINPTKINNQSFNIGMDGTKIAYSSTLIKLLPKNKTQTVLLHISPKYAFDSLYLGEDILKLSKLYHQNHIVKKEIITLNQNKLIQDFFWCQTYNNSVLGIIKNYLLPQYDYTSYHGYDPLIFSKDQEKIFKSILDKWEIKKCSEKLSLNHLYEIKLDEIKKYCNQNNKKLILFTSPIYKDDCKNDDIKLSEILKNKGFIYLNYTDFFKKNNSLNYWKDNTHLSNIGAEIFTDSLKRKLNQLK